MIFVIKKLKGKTQVPGEAKIMETSVLGELKHFD